MDKHYISRSQSFITKFIRSLSGLRGKEHASSVKGRCSSSDSDPFSPVPPVPLKTFTSAKLPVSIESASIRVRVSPLLSDKEKEFGIPGRFYIIEALDKDGNAKFVSRVQSFKFEADSKGIGRVTITYYDHKEAGTNGK